MFSPLRLGAVYALLAASVMLLGGCQAPEGKLTVLQDSTEFDRNVVLAKGPVLVDFYKDPCPTCVVQEAEIEKLFDEYQGRVSFVKFKIRDEVMNGVNTDIMERYNLFWVPTVILFVNGQEKQRWVFNHLAAEIRPSLNAALAGKAIPAAPVTAGNANPWSVGAAGVKPGECIEGAGCKLNRPGASGTAAPLGTAVNSGASAH